MTADEFAPAAQILDGAWPGEFTSAEERAYLFMLSDFEPEQVMAAIKALRGSRFRPAAGEIVEAIQGTTAAVPTFDEAWLLIREALNAAPRRPYTDHDQARHTAITVALGDMHPLVGAFVHRQGIRHLRYLPVDDPDTGHWAIKTLRVAWAEHVAAVAGRELTALASGRGAGDLTQLDPLARLGLGGAVPAQLSPSKGTR